MSRGPVDRSPIEDYLDDLLVSLAGDPPRRQRHLVAEADAHLHDAAAELMAAGIAAPEAERQAVARFGSAADIASAERSATKPTVANILVQLGVDGLFLGALGATAVGVSGLVAGVIRLFGGVGALADLGSGPALTPRSCTQWVPAGSTHQACQRAALADWAAETVFYRIAFGLLGIGLLALAVAARGYARRHGVGRLPSFVTNTVAATVFCVAGLWTLGVGIDAGVAGAASGQWFSAAAVALVAGLSFAMRLIHDLQGPRIMAVPAR